MKRTMPKRSRPPSLPVTLLVSLVQLATVTWVPMVHGSGLDSAAGATVEDTHSAECSVGHLETWCKICALSLSIFPAQVSRGAPLENTSSEFLRPTAAAPRALDDSVQAHPTRAPPAR